MHELSIASSIVESVLEFAAKNEIKKVLEVKLLIGELMAVEWEQLRFCYAAITRETAMEDSSLEIEQVEATVTVRIVLFGADQNIGKMPCLAGQSRHCNVPNAERRRSRRRGRNA